MSKQEFHAAFRAQLALPEQRHFFDYWLEKAAGRAMPDRADICPSDIPRYLPHVSLIDIETEPLNFRFRLAGTQLRDIYQQEVTNRHLGEFSKPQNRDYWLAACERIADTGRPAQGILRGPDQPRDHLVQFWIRLPLAIDGVGPKLILGLDRCVPVSDANNTGDIWDGAVVAGA